MQSIDQRRRIHNRSTGHIYHYGVFLHSRQDIFVDRMERCRRQGAKTDEDVTLLSETKKVVLVSDFYRLVYGRGDAMKSRECVCAEWSSGGCRIEDPTWAKGQQTFRYLLCNTSEPEESNSAASEILSCEMLIYKSQTCSENRVETTYQRMTGDSKVIPGPTPTPNQLDMLQRTAHYHEKKQ